MVKRRILKVHKRSGQIMFIRLPLAPTVLRNVTIRNNELLRKDNITFRNTHDGNCKNDDDCNFIDDNMFHNNYDIILKQSGDNVWDSVLGCELIEIDTNQEKDCFPFDNKIKLCFPDLNQLEQDWKI